jgi:hypothetical protein
MDLQKERGQARLPDHEIVRVEFTLRPLVECCDQQTQTRDQDVSLRTEYRCRIDPQRGAGFNRRQSRVPSIEFNMRMLVERR